MTMHKSSLLPDTQTTGNSRDLEWEKICRNCAFVRGRSCGRWDNGESHFRHVLISHVYITQGQAITKTTLSIYPNHRENRENNNKTTAIKGHGSYTTTDH